MAAKKHDKQKRADANRDVARNKKARMRFEVLTEFEAGIALSGNEVKSIREGGLSLDESYCRLRGGEMFLVGANITPYGKTGFDTPSPRRDRKLLLKKAELRRIASRVTERGLTIVPLKVFFKGPWAKIVIALAKGKNFVDKREVIKKREHKRELARGSKGRRSR